MRRLRECRCRDAHIRAERFTAHLDTLLNRDIRQIYPTTLLYSSLRALLEHLAHNQGRPFEIADAARASQISRITLKRVLFALEALFLIRQVPALGGSKPTIFRDGQGMATWLTKRKLESAEDIVRRLYANLRQEFHYRPTPGTRISYWRTRNDAEVPLVFDCRHGRLGIVAITHEEPPPKTLGSARAFLERFANAKVVVACEGRRVICKTPSLFWVPCWLLC